MADFHDSDDDDNAEPLSPSLRAESPSKEMKHMHPGGTLSLDKKWQLLMDGDEDLPDFTPNEVRNGIAVLLRRMVAYEEDARADRARLIQTHTELLNLKEKVTIMDTSWRDALKHVAVLPEVPTYQELVSSAASEPRAMTQWELWNMNHALTKLKAGGPVADEVTRIMDVKPVNGHVHWNFAGLTPRIQWHVFYHLMFRGTKKKKAMTARTAQAQKEIDEAGPVTSTSFERLSLRADSELDSSFYEEDEDEDLGLS